MQSLPIDYDFNTPAILQKVISANSALAELNVLISTTPNYELLLQPLTAREAVASSEIENIRTTTLELLQAELMQTSELTTEQKETLSYKQAIELGFTLVKEKKTISLDTILAIQKLVVPTKPGLRKKEVVIANRLGEVVYKPPIWSELEELLVNFETYTNSNSELDSLVDMAITHYQFESIHPFLDGNGRTGRILMVLLLVLKRKLQYPVLFLSGYILNSKAYYYELFAEVREHNNWKSWVLFFLNGVELQAKETMERIEEIKRLEKKLSLVIKKEFRTIDTQQLLNYLLSKAFYTQTNMVKELVVSRPTAARYLAKLHKLAWLENRKAGRELLYFIPEFMQILS
jgi:Fic family protein